MSHIVAPSLLAADLSRIAEAVALVDQSQAQWLHLDVMDGVFVPNISFGLPVIRSMRKHSKKVFDVHLMIIEPDRYIDRFKEAGADVLTVHVEACTHLHRTVQAIRQAGMKAGVALNPHTPVNALDEIMGDIDLVCLMSVNPGFGGQHFIPRTMDKLRALASMKAPDRAPLIEIDGGVTLANKSELLANGADVLVAGNTVFGAKDPMAIIESLVS